MESFRTEVNIEPSAKKLGHETNIVMFGSCFSEYIGKKLSELKFNVDLNPFGIMYNPMSIYKNIELLLEEKEYTKDDLGYDQGTWFSYDHHSSFSDPDPDTCLEKINDRYRHSSQNLRKADVLIITFGTAWAYLLLNTSRIVSNCHKQPAEKFDRFRLTDNQITRRYYILMRSLLEINPDLRIIFTVSPVRHWKDGPVDNSLSKSTLILAIHRIIKEFDSCEYFPSYEIAMDDLRDYRYYADDLVHPNNQMIEYIWNKFRYAYFTRETNEINKEISKIISARNHKPFHPDSEEHQAFLKKQLDQIAALKKKYPTLDFSGDEQWFSDRIGFTG